MPVKMRSATQKPYWWRFPRHDCAEFNKKFEPILQLKNTPKMMGEEDFAVFSLQ